MEPRLQIRPLSGVAATQFSPGRKAWVTKRRAAIPLAPPHPRKHFVSTPRAPIDGWPTLRDIGKNWMFSGRSSPYLLLSPLNFVRLASGRRLPLDLSPLALASLACHPARTEERSERSGASLACHPDRSGGISLGSAPRRLQI